MHIQDSSGKIGKDEPVFLLRAKDAIAPRTLRFWADDLERIGGDPVAIDTVREHAKLMEHWQRNNDCKLPDTPPEEVAVPGGMSGLADGLPVVEQKDISSLRQMVNGAKVLQKEPHRLKWNPDGYWLDGVLVVDLETAFHLAGT
jgi:hypothetical protein